MMERENFINITTNGGFPKEFVIDSVFRSMDVNPETTTGIVVSTVLSTAFDYIRELMSIGADESATHAAKELYDNVLTKIV